MPRPHRGVSGSFTKRCQHVPSERAAPRAALTQKPGGAQPHRLGSSAGPGPHRGRQPEQSTPLSLRKGQAPSYLGFQKGELPASSLKNKQMCPKWQLLNPGVVSVLRFPVPDMLRVPGDFDPCLLPPSA